MEKSEHRNENRNLPEKYRPILRLRNLSLLPGSRAGGWKRERGKGFNERFQVTGSSRWRERGGAELTRKGIGGQARDGCERGRRQEESSRERERRSLLNLVVVGLAWDCGDWRLIVNRPFVGLILVHLSFDCVSKIYVWEWVHLTNHPLILFLLGIWQIRKNN